jgi:catechol 2,3-dioxygenase-like lactoylglutathione lyase family enzyme
LRVVRFRSVALTTHALPALRAFYAGRLGLPLLDADERGFAVRAGATRLSFRAVPGPRPRVHHVAFTIAPDRLDDAIAWLERRVEVLRHEGSPVVPFPFWNAHATYFRDPAGNVLELIARHDLDLRDPYPFGPAGIRAVSEVGLPAGDVGAAVDALERLGIPRYSGDRRSFAAMGDVNGLFIVVPRGRVWFPTADVRGATEPVEVELADPGPWGHVPALGLTLRRR